MRMMKQHLLLFCIGLLAPGLGFGGTCQGTLCSNVKITTIKVSSMASESQVWLVVDTNLQPIATSLGCSLQYGTTTVMLPFPSVNPGFREMYAAALSAQARAADVGLAFAVGSDGTCQMYWIKAS